MALLLARYKKELGIVNNLTTHAKVEFNSNGKTQVILKSSLESGEFIIPIPFYEGKEVEILKSYSNGSYQVKFKKSPGTGRFSKSSITHVLGSHISWFLVDCKNWENQKRVEVRKRYGISNLDYTCYTRNL